MAQVMQIKCISRTEKMVPHERITHVGVMKTLNGK